MEHEMIDLYDEKGRKIGIIDKAIAHKEGRWHKSVHVWLINDKNELLLARRCSQKTFFPDCWDCAFAGHVGADESSVDCALREGQEEIGLKLRAEDFEYLFTYKDVLTWADKINNEFVDVFLVRKNIDLSRLVLQKEEVDNVKYMKLEEFFDLILNDKGDFLFHGKEEYARLKEILVPTEVLV